MIRHKLFCAVLTVICAFTVSLLTYAQSDRGVLTGNVTDAAGSVVPDATVTATNIGTNAVSRTTSTGDGVYTIPALPAGNYRVRVEKSGFKVSEEQSVAVAAATTTSVDAALEPGALTETVEITGEATQLQTNDAKISTTVPNRLVEELPLVVAGAVRSPFDLAATTPQAKNLGDGNFVLGGGQGGSWGMTLDSVAAGTSRFGSVQWASVNTPSLDAITEFTVDTNGYKAEFGRAMGGIMQFTSKSGTNALHGTLYEFVRNDFFDARRWNEVTPNIDAATGRRREGRKQTIKGVFKQHDFGFSVGGPILLPRFGEGGKAYLSGRDKAFFFVSGEFFRNRVGASSGTFSVPTPEMYNGDFSNWVDERGNRVPIYDPATTRPDPSNPGRFIRDPFPGNIIPRERFSNFARAVVGNTGVLQPNTGARPGTSQYVRNNYINTTGTVLDPWDKFSVKLDYNFSEKNRISGLYNFGQHQRVGGPEGFPGLPGVFGGERTGNQRSDVWRFNYTRVVTPTIVNYFFAGFNKWREINRSTNATGGWRGRGVCLGGAFDCDYNFPVLQFSDYNQWGNAAADGSENPIYSFGDDVTITRGRHTFKTGYLYERVHYNGFGRQTISGRAFFDRRLTSVPTNNNLTTGGGNSFAAFLLGTAWGGGTENDRFVRQQFRSHAMYFQDDWKINRKLTLNLGIRYEFTQPPLERDDKWSDFTPNRPNPRAGGIPGALRFAGFEPGEEGNRELVDTWFGGIGPRIGLAYSLDDKTVIRASASRSFGVTKAVGGSTHFEGAITIYNVDSANTGITPTFLTDVGIPGVPQPPSVDPSFSNGNSTAWWQNEVTRLPEQYDWSLSAQRQLPGDFVIETAYTATSGVHLVSGVLRYNQVPSRYLQQYGPAALRLSFSRNPAEVAALGIREPFPGFSQLWTNNGRSLGNDTVARALRPFPQYGDIDTGNGNGDRSGHSTYHAGILRLEKRFSQGFLLQSSYVFSKILTDSDNWGSGGALDHYNRRLEKSIGANDQTHLAKFNYVIELPFGEGRRFLQEGALSKIFGGFRLAGVHLYASGTPLGFIAGTACGTIPIFNGRCPLTVTSYEGWIADNNGDYRGSDRFFNRAAFPTQPTGQLGNSTRLNSKARTPS
ncbi:MAG: TonB-dependent receptor, partial [Pyrinomonadaceae bacterium]|nr:TonB-dependent receptor [Pyrinomonadaceae bacterium]